MLSEALGSTGMMATTYSYALVDRGVQAEAEALQELEDAEQEYAGGDGVPAHRVPRPAVALEFTAQAGGQYSVLSTGPDRSSEDVLCAVPEVA